MRADGPYEPPTTLQITFQRISMEFLSGFQRTPRAAAEYGTQRSEQTDEHIGSRLILMTWWREKRFSPTIAPQQMGILVGISQP